MGVLAGLGRSVLIGVNMLSALIALGLIACGIVIKVYLSKLLEDDLVDIFTKAVFLLFVPNTQVPSSVAFGPLTDTVGVILIVFGSLLLAISVAGCCTACCSIRWMLIAFGVMLGVLILGQVVFYSLVLPKNSPIHDSARDSLKEDIKNEYNRKDINEFTIVADIIFLAAECCGVDGPTDFASNPHLNFVFNGTTVTSWVIPPSCCTRDAILGGSWGDCTQNIDLGNSQGCYEKLQDVVEDWYPWLVPTIVIFIIVQLLEIIAALLIYKDDFGKGGAVV